jgi:hypothetical protein
MNELKRSDASSWSDSRSSDFVNVEGTQPLIRTNASSARDSWSGRSGEDCLSQERSSALTRARRFFSAPRANVTLSRPGLCACQNSLSRDNPEFPIVQYTHVLLKADQYRFGLLVSSAQSADAFAAGLRALISGRSALETMAPAERASAPRPQQYPQFRPFHSRYAPFRCPQSHRNRRALLVQTGAAAPGDVTLAGPVRCR